MLSHHKYRTLSLKDVKIDDPFWGKYIDLVLDKVIPYQWEILNDRVPGATPSGCIRNFRIAAGEETGPFTGMVFQDTDVAKWLEAVACGLCLRPDEKLEAVADEVIALIGRAQQPDGYLNTYYTIKEPENRFKNLEEGHELYTAGHMTQAAVAYYRATGKKAFLDIVCRMCSHMDQVFGAEPEKLHGYPGHQEIELALVELYDVTGEERYLNLARYFIDQRGKEPLIFAEQRKSLDHYVFPEFAQFDRRYNQTHQPAVDQRQAWGHAVRAVYMYSAMADLAGEQDNPELLEACQALYRNIVEKKLYITGSIGASEFGERFAGDYDLPNDTNYSETCASIGLAMFSKRMACITGNAEYADTMERCLYNTLLSGISLNGTEFFYVNPLEVWPDSCQNNSAKRHVKTQRQKWFGVACCPPNIARTIASIGRYAYSSSDDRINVDLYLSSTADFHLKNGDVTLKQSTRYPYDGVVEMAITCRHPQTFTVAVRIPGWCDSWRLTMDGKPVSAEIHDGYAEITQEWKENQLLLEMDNKPKLYQANLKVRADTGCVAIQKGPLVYCLEQADNGAELHALAIDPMVELTEEFDPELLNGTVVIHGKGKRQTEQKQALYYPVDAVKGEEVALTAIPYCLWNNRGEGEMTVWIRRI